MNSVSPEFKELERLRSIARHNEASALRFERDEGRNEIIELLESGKSPDEIIKEYRNK